MYCCFRGHSKFSTISQTVCWGKGVEASVYSDMFADVVGKALVFPDEYEKISDSIK